MKKKEVMSRLKIITPFLQKEKSLKEIASETEVSYATLKRWVKSYKEKGETGLQIKERNDKNSFRKADSSLIKKIEKVYEKNKEKTLIELYDKIRINLEATISFNTFYRIINNLDSYLKNKSKFQVNKNLEVGEVYLIKSFISYHFVIHNNLKKLPIIFLAFNASTLDFIEFHIAFSPKFDAEFSSFLRKIIIKGCKNYGIESLPKEILIDSIVSIPKKLKEELYSETNIKILEFEPNSDDINKFIFYLENDLNRVFAEEVEYDRYIEFFKEYSKYYNLKTSKEITSNFLEKLNPFLAKAMRKIFNKGIRNNNIFYYSEELEKYIGTSKKIFYDPQDNNYIFVSLDENILKKIERLE